MVNVNETLYLVSGLICRRKTSETRGYIRCNWAALSCFFSRSTSFFKKRMWRIMFSGESISMEMSLGDGGAETGWSNFSCRILYWKKIRQGETVCLWKTKQHTSCRICFIEAPVMNELQNEFTGQLIFSAPFISTSGHPYLAFRAKDRAEGSTLLFFPFK